MPSEEPSWPRRTGASGRGSTGRCSGCQPREGPGQPPPRQGPRTGSAPSTVGGAGSAGHAGCGVDHGTQRAVKQVDAILEPNAVVELGLLRRRRASTIARAMLRPLPAAVRVREASPWCGPFEDPLHLGRRESCSCDDDAHRTAGRRAPAGVVEKSGQIEPYPCGRVPGTCVAAPREVISAWADASPSCARIAGTISSSSALGAVRRCDRRLAGVTSRAAPSTVVTPARTTGPSDRASRHESCRCAPSGRPRLLHPGPIR